MEIEQSKKRIQISSDQLRYLKNNFQFIRIIRLQRVVNQIYFCYEMYLSVLDDETPTGNRTRYNSLLFSFGVFNECFDLLKQIVHSMSEFKSFTKETTKLLVDPEIIRFKHLVVKMVRDKIAYHIDKDMIKITLEMLKDKDGYNFIRSNLDKDGEIHFELADFVAMYAIIYDSESKKMPENSQEALGQIFSQFIDFSRKVLLISNQLISEYTLKLGLTVEEIP